jgi:hypothetical protein
MRLGQGEHAVVIERAAAAELHRRHDYLEAGVFQNLDRGLRRGRVKVIIPGIGP